MFSAFFDEVLFLSASNRLKTAIIYERYKPWARANGYKALSNQEFVGELRRRYEVLHDRAKGNVIVGYDMKK